MMREVRKLCRGGLDVAPLAPASVDGFGRKEVLR